MAETRVSDLHQHSCSNYSCRCCAGTRGAVECCSPEAIPGGLINYSFINYYHIIFRNTQQVLISAQIKMCICIVTTAHPQFPFILINNRDVCLLSLLSHFPLSLFLVGTSLPPNCPSSMVGPTTFSHPRWTRPAQK